MKRTPSEVPDVPARDSPPDVSWQEVKAILDEEVERLPERYRVRSPRSTGGETTSCLDSSVS